LATKLTKGFKFTAIVATADLTKNWFNGEPINRVRGAFALCQSKCLTKLRLSKKSPSAPVAICHEIGWFEQNSVNFPV